MYVFQMTDFPGQELLSVGATLGVSSNPENDNTWFVPTSQEAAEFTVSQQTGDGGVYPVVTVWNNTCSEYWIRVVATFAPAAASDGGADAAEGDEATSDTDADAGSDADAAEDAD
jgi:hypothetical protein